MNVISVEKLAVLRRRPMSDGEARSFPLPSPFVFYFHFRLVLCSVPCYTPKGPSSPPSSAMSLRRVTLRHGPLLRAPPGVSPG